MDPSLEIELVLDGFFVLSMLAELAYRDDDRFITYKSSGYLTILLLIFFAGTFPSM